MARADIKLRPAWRRGEEEVYGHLPSPESQQLARVACLIIISLEYVYGKPWSN